MTNMSRKGTKRLVVCVDGTWFGPDGASSHGSENKSNVFRIYASIKEGRFTDQSGNTIIQSRQYFPGVGVGKPFLEKAMDGWTGDGCNDMILNIFQYICNNLTDSNDELWMFGFSRGAYVVRAVSSMLRYLRALSLPRNGEEGIDKEALKTYSMMRRDQADEIRRNSGKLYHFFRSRTRESPIIQFLGLFDTVKATNDHLRHDLSFSDNINHVRHALALNENRTLFAPELYEPFVNTNMSNHRSLIQAWFVGAHSDMGGGSAEDGLSLYPLQWMLIESRRIGLALEFLTEDSLASVFEDPIKLARVPALNPAPEAETGEKSKQEAWQFPYSNGIVVSMNDLRPSHNYGNLQGSPGTKLVKNRPVRQQHSVNETGSEDLRRSFFTKLRPLRSSRKDGRSSSRAVVTDDLPPISRHLIAINRGATYVLRGKDREVFEDGKLKGYLSTEPSGNIIHPSVFFHSDTYPRHGVSEALRPFIKDLLSFRDENMPIKQPPWIREDDLDYWTNEFKQFRVLVCGRAGVGKSTLINRVFGIDMTTVSHQAHGIHDIDQGFETDTRPGIIIHDSRGFALGSVKEVEMFSSFIKKRCSPKASSEDQLHAVWLCIEIGSNRMIHAAEEHLFQILRDHAAGVPVVVIGTQTDKYRHEHFNKIRERLQSTSTYEDTRAGATLLSLDNRVKQEYKVNFEERKQQFENQILTMNKSTSRVPLFAYVSHDDPASITTLLKITREHTLDIGAAKGLMAAQTINVELKIEEAIDSTVFLLRCAVNIAAVGTVVPLGLVNLTSTPTLSWMLCKNIVACFGIASSSSTKTTITPTRKATRSTTFGFGKEKNGIGKQRNGPLEKTTEESTTLITIDEIEKITRKILTGNLRAFMLQEVAQNIALWGGMATLTLFTVFGGVPLFIGASLMEAAPAAQMVVKCACDLILILDKAYHDGNGTVTKAGIEEVVEWYCRGGDGKDRAGARGENGTGKSEKMRSPQPDLMTTTTTTKKDARTKARSLQSRVHREIAGLIPIASVKFWKGFQISRIRIGMEDIVARNRVVLPLVEESGQIHSCGRNLNASRDQTDSLRRLLPDVDADEGDESTLSWASMHSSDDDDDTEKDELL